MSFNKDYSNSPYSYGLPYTTAAYKQFSEYIILILNVHFIVSPKYGNCHSTIIAYEACIFWKFTVHFSVVDEPKLFHGKSLEVQFTADASFLYNRAPMTSTAL
jgi:hypothetical protein